MFGRKQLTVVNGELVTLDDAWREAERIGRVRVDTDGIGSKDYKVEIHLTRPSGSWLWAAGCDRDILTAVLKAIDEAKRLRAA